MLSIVSCPIIIFIDGDRKEKFVDVIAVVLMAGYRHDGDYRQE